MSVKFTPGDRPTFDASAGIRAGLEVIGRDADKRVPVGDDSFTGSGDLRASQVIAVEGNTGGIGYTDRAAVPAHERLDLAPAEGKQRKYLESAVNGNRAAVLEAIAQDLRRALS